MNREDIIRMADKAGFEICRGDGWPDERLIPKMVRFAALVAAAEREACASVCEEHWEIDGWRTAQEFAAAIRARGEKK